MCRGEPYEFWKNIKKKLLRNFTGKKIKIKIRHRDDDGTLCGVFRQVRRRMRVGYVRRGHCRCATAELRPSFPPRVRRRRPGARRLVWRRDAGASRAPHHVVTNPSRVVDVSHTRNIPRPPCRRRRHRRKSPPRALSLLFFFNAIPDGRVSLHRVEVVVVDSQAKKRNKNKIKTFIRVIPV